MGYVAIVVGTVLPLWLPVTCRCRKPSGGPNELLIPASGDRVDSTLEELVLLVSSVVDVAPGSLLDLGGMVESVLLLALAVPPELKSLWRLFFGVNTRCTV